MKVEDLATELADGKFRPAYLLAGEEALLRDESLALLRGAVLDGTADDFNHHRLDAGTTTPAALLDALGTLPVMAPRRLVELRIPESRWSGAKDLLDALADVVRSHLEQQDSVLLITVSKPDKRQRWVKALGKAPAAIVACDAPKDAKGAVGFLRAEAKRQGVSLESGAAERLAELVGPQLLLLRQEIAKAALLAGADSKVTVAHVEDATLQSAEQPVWDLNDAVGAGQTTEALEILSRLSGVAPEMLLGVLASHFRRLSRVRGGGTVNGPAFVKRKLESQARRFSPARLEASMRAIHETDVALKGGSKLSREVTIERLVLALSS